LECSCTAIFRIQGGCLRSGKANGGFLAFARRLHIDEYKIEKYYRFTPPYRLTVKVLFSFCRDPTVTETVYKYLSRPVLKEAPLTRFWKGVKPYARDSKQCHEET
jgi:hypothetical protein